MESRRARRAVLLGGLLLLGVLGWAVYQAHETRHRVESTLRMTLPEGAADFEWEDFSSFLEDNVLVAFTVEPSDFDDLASRLACRPTDGGVLLPDSRLGPAPLAPGERACTHQVNPKDWTVVRVSPLAPTRLRVAVEIFSDY